MKDKKNKFFIFFAFNIFLLLIILLLAIPVSEFLSKINLDDNEFVSEQVIISSNSKSPITIDRIMEIKFIAQVDNLLDWEFKALEDNN